MGVDQVALNPLDPRYTHSECLAEVQHPIPGPRGRVIDVVHPLPRVFLPPDGHVDFHRCHLLRRLELPDVDGFLGGSDHVGLGDRNVAWLCKMANERETSKHVSLLTRHLSTHHVLRSKRVLTDVHSLRH